MRRASGDGRRPRPGEAGWGKLVALAYARAALAALDLAQDLSRRAARLADAAPKLRAKGKGRALEALLDDDAVSAAAPIARFERPRPAAPVRAPGRARRRARAHRPRRPSASTGSERHGAEGRARSPTSTASSPTCRRSLRWREWKARVEAVLFAAPKPVTREILARVVGRDCALDLLLDDLREDLRGRPIELVRAGESFMLHTRPAFGPTVRVAFDIPADAKQLTKLEAGVLMAVAMFQPVTRGEISEMFGREISRDLIAALTRGGADRRRAAQPEARRALRLRDDGEVSARIRVRVAARPAGPRGAEGCGAAVGRRSAWCWRRGSGGCRRRFTAAGGFARSRRVAGETAGGPRRRAAR